MKGAIVGASFEAAEEARRRGALLRSDMVHSRGASALGAAIALGEVDEHEVSDAAICARWDLYSGVASVSAKPGLRRTEIMLLGNSAHWDGDVMIDHGVMRDILDVDAIRDTLARLGLSFGFRPSVEQTARVVGVFAKAEADPRGTIRGQRHVMLDDDDIDDTRYSRCSLNAVLASVLGDTAVYVSTRAEHMGPLGGGPLAILARVPEPL
jgi:cyanuric acid amidohydrolase